MRVSLNMRCRLLLWLYCPKTQLPGYMKSTFPIAFTAFFLFLFAAQWLPAQRSIQFLEQPEWEEVIKEAQRTHKVIFFDAYTTWCGPCKRMEKEVFSRQAEADFFNRNFLNVKYDMERGQGRELRKRFGVKVFPTYLFIDVNGNVLHRIVGAHTAEGVFLNSAKKALTMNGYLAALEIRYNRGERNPKFMLEYLDALHMAGEQKKEQELAEGFMKLMSADHFMDKDYWQLLDKYLQDPSSRLFRLLFENRSQIADVWGKEVVTEKVLGILEQNILSLRQNLEADTSHLPHLIALLRSEKDLPRQKELLARTLCIRYQRQGDWFRYAATVEAMLEFDFLTENPFPLRELDFHAANLAYHCKDANLQGIALDWSTRCCRQESRPEELAWFLKTKAHLLALLGNGEAAAQTEAEALAKASEAERKGLKRKNWQDPDKPEGEAVGAKFGGGR
ncbi:MAG: hypothetical protein CMN32_17590 [Saprospirales bacterium]|nr:hypothetical protein [Saprospirales bacterium]